MAQDTSEILRWTSPLRSGKQGGLIDQLMYGTLMQVYPLDPFFTAGGNGDRTNNTESMSLGSFYGNKIPGNKEVDFGKFLKDDPGYAVMKAKSSGTKVAFPLFFQPLGVPKVVAFSLTNIANNGFFNADVRHAFAGKCDYETIIKASQSANAPIITNESWLDWESSDVLLRNMCSGRLNPIQRREYQRQGLVFDPMVTTNLLFLLPIEDNAQYFVLSGDGLEIVTKEGRRINAIEKMSRGPKFSFLLPNLEKESVVGSLKSYYNRFMSEALSKGLSPAIAGQNTSNSLAAGGKGLTASTLKFATGEGSSLVLWLIVGLALSPDDPAFINKLRMSGTPYKSESFSVSDLESATGNDAETIKAFHTYTLQSVVKRLFETFDMLYRSLERGESRAGELSIISTQG